MVKALRILLALPFLVAAILAWICEAPFNAFGVLCLRTLGYIAKMPAVDDMLSRMFLIRAVRCPRCGRSDVTTIVDER